MEKSRTRVPPDTVLHSSLSEEPLESQGDGVKTKVEKQKVKAAQLCLTPHGLYSPWKSPGQKTGVGSHSLLQEIFPSQGSNPGLPHCGQILYQLSHQGSPRILEWIAIPFSSRSSRPRNQTRVSCVTGGLYQLRYQGSPRKTEFV